MPSPKAPPNLAPGPLGIVMQFVVVPFLIVAVCLSIYGFFTWAFQDRRSFPEYLRAIESGWESERWQATYELQFRLRDKNDPIREKADAIAMICLFERAKGFQDPRVRAQLAIALGHLGDPRAEASLIDALNDEGEETRLNAIYSLSCLKSKDAVPHLLRLLNDAERFEPASRVAFLKLVAFALGEIGETTAREPLHGLLSHGSDEVRWNATLALARLKDPRAIPSLRAMLDRRNLNRIQGMRPEQKERVILNALSAAAILEARELRDAVDPLAKNDPSFKVRQLALELLEKFDRAPK